MSSARLVLFSLIALVLIGCGSSGQFATTPASPAAPAHVSITVNPHSVQPGQSATLGWSSFNAGSCTASGDWSGPQQPSGSHNLVLQGPKPMTFTLACTGPGGTDTGTVTLLVAAPSEVCKVPLGAAKPMGKRKTRAGRSAGL